MNEIKSHFLSLNFLFLSSELCSSLPPSPFLQFYCFSAQIGVISTSVCDTAQKRFCLVDHISTACIWVAAGIISVMYADGKNPTQGRAAEPLQFAMRNYTRRQGQGQWGGAMAGLLVLLLPVFFPRLFTPLSHASPSIFSEWNNIKPRHSSLLKSALQRETPFQHKVELWAPLPQPEWKPCIDLGLKPTIPEKSEGYIQVFLDGGLNQQRMGVCDAVALAKILNATLVIPHLEINPVWQDSSTFMEIYDVEHFINVLKDDVRIVKQLPDEFSWSTREYYATGIRDTRIKTAHVGASANWYLENVLPVLRSHGIAAISPFSHRLDFDNMAVEIQHLRCKVNFQALTFVPHIRSLGDALVSRLRYSPSSNEEVVVGSNSLREEVTNAGQDKKGVGKFVVLHLRFDKDMAAHSACDFGGGKAEKLALAKYRQVIWQGRVINSQFTDEELRSHGRCPLTPEEIGLVLAALGFDNTTRLYLASHKVYGGEARISALRSLFPLMEDKKSLTSSEERGGIRGKASLLAALDYYVGMHSDVFISASPGNMHNAMVGHRTYENMKTIRPNMALLGQLFFNKSLSWSDFEAGIIKGHKNRHGQIKLRKAGQSVYTYPAPDCMCHAAAAAA